MKRMYFDTTFETNEINSDIINPTFIKGTIVIMDYVQIANRTKFTRNGILNAMSGLSYLPVRGYYIPKSEGEGDFQGHSISYYIDDEGNLKKEVLTTPLGVVIDGTQRLEHRSVNGKDREVLVCDCYLWRDNNPEAIDKVKENLSNQSMEILVDKSTDMGDYLQIDEFTFTSLCIIGTEPAFDCGNIRINNYSKQDFKVNYQKMIEALDRFLNFEKEGGDKEMPKNKEDIKDKENIDNEEQMAKQEDKVEEESKDEKNMENNEEEAEKENFELEIATLKEKCLELENKNIELNKNYEVIIAEVNELRQYKADKEAEYRKIQEEKIFSKFEDIKDEEKFIKLVNDKANYSLEELEEKCYAIKGMVYENNQIKKQNKKVEEKKPLVDKIYSADLEDNKVGKYDAFIKKYSNK